jgi:hypothetical protein
MQESCAETIVSATPIIVCIKSCVETVVLQPSDSQQVGSDRFCFKALQL